MATHDDPATGVISHRTIRGEEGTMRRLLIAFTAALTAVVAFAAPVGAIVYGQLADDGEFDNVGALIGEYQERTIFCDPIC
jgi:hypothetical protein